MSLDFRVAFGVAASLIMAVAFYRRLVPDQLQASIASAKQPNSRTRAAIDELVSALPNHVFVRGHPSFQASIRSYFSSQAQELIPACVVQPATREDVSTAVRILSIHISRKISDAEEPLFFAIRSGGHNPTKGCASVEGGIVLDLKHLNAVTLSDDRTSIDLGPAARWMDVYGKLDPLGLSVAGGRASTVGVGGLLLGGGLSFHSPQVGFSCDNVVSFEVVLADGRIVTADATTNPDLAIALRGGGNNFGVVTRFTMRVFPQSNKIFAGYYFFYAKEKDRLIQAFNDFCEPEGYDVYSNCILTFSYTLGQIINVGSLQHMKSDKKPAALAPFLGLKRFWTIAKLCTMTEATSQINGFIPGNQRWLWHTTTFENDNGMVHFCYDSFKATLGSVKGVKGLVLSIIFQPLTPHATAKSDINAMGLKTDKTLTIFEVSVSWKRAQDDGAVIGTAESLVERIEEEAKKRGLYHPFKYVNYCSASQSPYEGYGPGKRELLRETSRKYDPQQVFQKGIVGSYKL